MKKWELVEMLEDYDDDDDIYIGMVQEYGSDFAYRISGMDYYGVLPYYGNLKPCVPCIMLGSQIGTLTDPEDDYEEEEDD